MTMAPIVDDPEICRPMFKGLRELSEKIREENIQNIDMKYLSMGMTQDFRSCNRRGRKSSSCRFRSI